MNTTTLRVQQLASLIELIIYKANLTNPSLGRTQEVLLIAREVLVDAED